MKIIGLQGRARCGKTTTLKMLIRHLQRLSEWTLIHSATPLDESTDWQVCFKTGRKKFAVCTGGDPGENYINVRDNGEYACSHNADALVTACRTRGSTVDDVIKLAGSTEPIFIPKSCHDDIARHVGLNKRDMDKILTHLP